MLRMMGTLKERWRKERKEWEELAEAELGLLHALIIGLLSPSVRRFSCSYPALAWPQTVVESMRQISRRDLIGPRPCGRPEACQYR